MAKKKKKTYNIFNNLKFKAGDRVTNATFGPGTIDNALITDWGEKVYLISHDKYTAGRSVNCTDCENTYTQLEER